MGTGWIKLHRAITETEMWFQEPFTRSQAWIDLVLHANHKKGMVIIRGNVVKVDRGQLAWSELTMAKRWQWSRNKVRGFLKLLENEQQIEQQKLYRLTTLTTILNYEKYQKGTTDDTTEGQQKDNRRYTNKNVKNDKNVKKIYSEQSSQGNEVNQLIALFEEVNPAYERLFANKTQRKSIENLLKKFGYVDLEKAIKSLAISNQREYAPTVTTPRQLEDKLGSLKAYWDKERNKQNKKRVIKI